MRYQTSRKMSGGKGIYIGLFFVLGILLVSSIAFGQEPDLAPFDATVTVGNALPVIVAFRPIIEEPDDIYGITGDGRVLGAPGLTVDARVSFIVEDPNGPVDLPGDVGDGAPVLVPGDIALSLTRPVDGITGTVRVVDASSCFATECASGTNSNCDAATVGLGDGTDFTLQKQYTCDVTMEYFDEPSTGPFITGDEVWTIDVAARDVAGATDGASSGDPGFDEFACTTLTNCDYMDYLTITGISTTGEITWTAIDIDDVDTGADGPLAMDNFGNVAVASVDVEGMDLTGVNNPAAIMEVAAFGAGADAGGLNSGSCDVPGGGGIGSGGELLIDSTPVEVTAPIPYTGSGSDTGDLNFCIWAALNPDYLSGPGDTEYTATGANDWEVTFNSF